MGEQADMASLHGIAAYWRTAEDTEVVLPNLRAHWIGWGEPFCFACGWLAPVPDGPKAWRSVSAGRWLDRAHLAARCTGGSGEPSNLVPLCHWCHQEMDRARWGDRESALEWINGRERRAEHWQLFTDLTWIGRTPPSDVRAARMYRMRMEYLQVMAA